MLYRDYLKKITSCPFCHSKDRILISKKHAYLTYAKAPYHPDHLLIIPIRHITSYFDITKEENEDISKLIKVGAKILKKLKYNNFTILVREGDGSNKSVKHLHYHLIPNDRIGDLDHQGIQRKILSDKAIKTLSTKIISLIKSK